MTPYKYIFVYGFAIFSMFFGSGNLVFPLEIGALAGREWIISALGLFISGILLPFCGLFVIKLHQGNYLSFFGEAGKFARFLLPLFTLSLLGAFGVVPRCITVAHGGISSFAPDLSPALFGGAFCLVMFFLCLKDHLMVKVLGKYLSPLLLVALATLIFGAAFNPPEAPPLLPMKEAFSTGFLTGYQTMDLFAAFFFSSLIFSQLQQEVSPTASPKEIVRYALKPSLFGALLLTLIYLGFVFLGAHYSALLHDAPPQAMLSRIALATMGEGATLFIAIAIIFSCLTTAVALNNIYARYLCSLFHTQRQAFPWVLAGTTGISFLLSLLDFTGIAAFLAPALEISYPGLIALTLMSIVTERYKSLKVTVFYGLSFLMVFQVLLR